MRVEKAGYVYNGFKLGQKVVYHNKEMVVIGFVEGASYSIAINACYHNNISNSAYKDELVVLEGFETSQFLWVSEHDIETIEDKKETVLEIEYEMVMNDYYALRITKQNYDVLPRGEFKDDELSVYSVSCFAANQFNLFLRGTNKDKDNLAIIIEKHLIDNIMNKVRLINEKYGITKRWRAKKGKTYYCIDGHMAIDYYNENFDTVDDGFYNSYNYFKTKEDAEKKLTKIKNILMED